MTHEKIIVTCRGEFLGSPYKFGRSSMVKDIKDAYVFATIEEAIDNTPRHIRNNITSTDLPSIIGYDEQTNTVRELLVFPLPNDLEMARLSRARKRLDEGIDQFKEIVSKLIENRTTI